MISIMWVGLRPSKKNLDIAIPFQGTESGKRIQRWLGALEKGFTLSHYFANCYSEVEGGDLSLNFNGLNRFDLVIGMGGEVHGILNKKNISYLAIPHPSPRNRIWNSKNKETEVLEIIRGKINEKISRTTT